MLGEYGPSRTSNVSYGHAALQLYKLCGSMEEHFGVKELEGEELLYSSVLLLPSCTVCLWIKSSSLTGGGSPGNEL